jgi:hypothetical protein
MQAGKAEGRKGGRAETLEIAQLGFDRGERLLEHAAVRRCRGA